MNSEITLLARAESAASWARTASAAVAGAEHEPSLPAARPDRANSASARPLMPPQVWNRKSRRDRKFFTAHLMYKNSFKFSSTCVRSTSLCFAHDLRGRRPLFRFAAGGSAPDRYASSTSRAGSVFAAR